MNELWRRLCILRRRQFHRDLEGGMQDHLEIQAGRDQNCAEFIELLIETPQESTTGSNYAN